MAIIASIATCLRKFADFTGTASRAEFSCFLGFSFFVCATAYWLGIVAYAIVALALPLSAVTIRRGRESGLTAGFTLMLIIAPVVVFYLFLAIQDMIEALLGFDVPYDLISTTPGTAALLFFGFILLFSLFKKGGTSRVKVSSERPPVLWGISASVSTNSNVAKTRMDAERQVTDMTTPLIKAFGLRESRDNKVTLEGRTKADASIATACNIVLDLCAYFGHGIYAPQFDNIFVEIEQQLQASDWRAVLEGGLRIDVENQACARILHEHAGELRNSTTDINVSNLLRDEKERISEFDEKAHQWPRFTAYYAPKGAGGVTFIAIEKSQASYADTYLRIRLALAEEDALTALRMLRSATLYESFRHSFSDCPPVYPAFGDRIIVGKSPIQHRDGLGLSLKITDLGPGSLKLLEERGLVHPPCYVVFEMHERLM